MTMIKKTSSKSNKLAIRTAKQLTVRMKKE